MAESVIQWQKAEKNNPRWLRILVWEIAIATLILMAIGSATRVMNAGLACPDWPLCYGQLVPSEQMNLQVFLEWFHRLDAALIGLSAIALTALSWWYRSQFPTWVPPAATLALGLIVFQGILGALTVTELLRFDLVTAHLATALPFFTTLIIIAASLTPYEGSANGGQLFAYSLIGAVLIYLQSLLGALVASRWALHQCLGNTQLCLVVNSHILGVIPPTLAIVILAIKTWRTPALPLILRRLANLSLWLVILQISLGVATFHFHLQIEPLTVAHQLIGATLLGTLVILTVSAKEAQQPSTLSKAITHLRNTA